MESPLSLRLFFFLLCETCSVSKGASSELNSEESSTEVCFDFEKDGRVDGRVSFFSLEKSESEKLESGSERTIRAEPTCLFLFLDVVAEVGPRRSITDSLSPDLNKYHGRRGVQINCKLKCIEVQNVKKDS